MKFIPAFAFLGITSFVVARQAGRAGNATRVSPVAVVPGAKRPVAAAVLATAVATGAWAQGFPRGHPDALGPQFEVAPQQRDSVPHRPPPRGADSLKRLLHWNQIAIDASGLDHTPLQPGERRVFGEQLGPGRSSRAMAIVHIAMFDALNAIDGGYRSYTGLPARARRRFDRRRDRASGARHAGRALSVAGGQRSISGSPRTCTRSAPAGARRRSGIEVGRRAAAAILARRANDGSQHAEPRVGIDFVPSNAPGQWRQDPMSRIPLALGAHWGGVSAVRAPVGAQFRVPPPPAMTSREYTAAFNEVKRLGGDGVTTPTVRTEQQRLIGIYWAYDGTPSLCAPPRLYNQIAVQIARERGTKVRELARLLALVNIAMADAGIAIWESKYFYEFWRPVTGIREADPGTGPTGAGDGNPATIGDPKFMPLGAPASNLTGPNFTPPFPAYPSGHAGFGGALFQMLREFYGTDHIAFTFVSDELNGMTLRTTARPAARPAALHIALGGEEENGQSRIYLGIHWAFDKTEGIAQGRRVADYVFRNAFEPVRHER